MPGKPGRLQNRPVKIFFASPETETLRGAWRESWKSHDYSGSATEQQFCSVSRARVAKHMRSLGLKSKLTRKYVVTTDSKHAEPFAKNILNRQFSVAAPNQVWVTDITYLKVGRKWHYLTVLIDLFSRMVVGWDLSDLLERHSAMKAFQKTLGRRRPKNGLLVQ